jgi:small subunit ribosomal protein S4
MRKIKKKFQKPRSRWDSERIKKENESMKTYGLTKKQEVWKVESILRSFRRRARGLAAKRDKVQEKVLIDKLHKMGLLEKDASVDAVLSLTSEKLLERRLQTFVFKKNLANTIRHSRQLITHGHIAVDGRKIVYPSFIVTRGLEDKISFYKSPKLKAPIKTVETTKAGE